MESSIMDRLNKAWPQSSYVEQSTPFYPRLHPALYAAQMKQGV